MSCEICVWVSKCCEQGQLALLKVVNICTLTCSRASSICFLHSVQHHHFRALERCIAALIQSVSTSFSRSDLVRYRRVYNKGTVVNVGKMQKTRILNHGRSEEVPNSSLHAVFCLRSTVLLSCSLNPAHVSAKVFVFLSSDHDLCLNPQTSTCLFYLVTIIC